MEKNILEMVSLPAWGVWIEIAIEGLDITVEECHSPHGECGLKCHADGSTACGAPSLPAWGVWIEIESTAQNRRWIPVTPRMGSVD